MPFMSISRIPQTHRGREGRVTFDSRAERGDRRGSAQCKQPQLRKSDPYDSPKRVSKKRYAFNETWGRNGLARVHINAPRLQPRSRPQHFLSTPSESEAVGSESPFAGVRRHRDEMRTSHADGSRIFTLLRRGNASSGGRDNPNSSHRG